MYVPNVNIEEIIAIVAIKSKKNDINIKMIK